MSLSTQQDCQSKGHSDVQQKIFKHGLTVAGPDRDTKQQSAVAANQICAAGTFWYLCYGHKTVLEHDAQTQMFVWLWYLVLHLM